MPETIRDRIQERLVTLGKSAQQASREAGLSRDFLRTFFNRDTSSPRAENLERLAPVLETSVAWLLTGEGAMPEGDSGMVSEKAVWNAVFALIERKVLAGAPPHAAAEAVVSIARWLDDDEKGKDTETGIDTVISYEAERLKRAS